MNMQPKVTIGILAYNAEGTIARAIRSAQAQDYSNLEILIIDDCSTDQTVTITSRLAASDERIRIIKNQENKGPAYGRAQVTEMATGDVICFFDDDDESYPTRVSTQLATLIDAEKEFQGRLVACYASGVRLYPNGYQKTLRAIGSEPIVPEGGIVADYLLFFAKQAGVFYGAGVPACALLVRKSALQKVGGFDKDLRRVEDVDFAIRLALADGVFVGTKQILFTQYSTNAADKSPEKNMLAEKRVARKYAAYLRRKKMYYHSLYWPTLRYAHFSKNYVLFAGVLCLLFISQPWKTLTHLFASVPGRFAHERRIKENIS
jgi:glycosyltransferase involved in cell wall biosynthesis